MNNSKLIKSKPISTTISIVENSYIFINESLRHYKRTGKKSKCLPFSIFLLIQGLELLMKEVLKNEHPILIYENIDNPKNTVSISQGLERLISISNIEIDQKEKKIITKAIHYRNLVLHFELTFNNYELRSNFIELFEFVHYFHKKHLNIELHNFIDKILWEIEAELMADFKKNLVHYNGIEVAKNTPKNIVEFQKYNGIQRNDEIFSRIKYGEEKYERFSNPCHDCGCLKGQFHTDGCDVEECPICEGQFLACECHANQDIFYVQITVS